MKHLLSCLFVVIISTAKADQIPLSEISSSSRLSYETRVLVAKLGHFQLDDQEAEVLASTAGAADAVIELTDLVQEFEHLANVFWSLRLRKDLTEAQLGHIRQRLESLVGDMEGGRKAVYKQQGLWLLGNYPSDESERVLIRFLSERTHPKHSDYSDVAAVSLGKIGTSKALESLQQYAERAKPPEGYESRGYDAAIKSMEQIRTRAALGRTPTVSDLAQSVAQPADLENRTASAQEGEKEIVKSLLLKWGIIVALLLVGVLLLLRLYLKRGP